MDAVPGGSKCGIGIGTWAYQTSKSVLRGRERKREEGKKGKERDRKTGIKM